MRSRLVSAFCSVTALFTGACTPVVDTAHKDVSLSPPYSDLPAAPAGGHIEPGKRTPLDARQQEVVVAGVAKWMKEPKTIQLGTMTAVRDRNGVVTVCGEVTGRNGAGVLVGMAPYIGVLMGSPASPEFVVVAIASSGRERAEVVSLCQEAGAAS